MTIPLDSATLIARFDASVSDTWPQRRRVNHAAALRSLARHVAPGSLAEVTADHLAGWSNRLRPGSRRVWLPYVDHFYEWARTHRVRDGNPVVELRERGSLPPRPKPADGTLEDLALRWVRERQTARNITPKTANAERYMLLMFVEACGSTDPTKVTKRDVLRWMGGQEAIGATTRYLYFTVVRRFLSWLVEEGHLARNPMRAMKPPARTRTAHRSLGLEQVRTLLEACEDDRERLIVVVGVHTGLRRAELAALQIGDVSLSARTLHVRHGKGGHSRVVPLSAEACELVGRFLADNGLSSGPLLRSEQFPQRGISPGHVGRIMEELATRAGVKVGPYDGVGVHSLRHTMASDVYAATRDVLVVRDILGHVNLGTTERYVSGLNLEAMREAVEGRSYLADPAGTDGGAR